MPDNWVDSIITDPPYGLEFMGQNWDYGIPGTPYWREALRIAKPGAFLLAFGGTRTYHRLVCAIEDAGWQVRDCIMYLHDGSQQQRAFLESLTPDQLEAYLELHYPNFQMEWVYSQGMKKGLDIGKEFDKRGEIEREVIGYHMGWYPDSDRPGQNAYGGKGSNSVTLPPMKNGRRVTAPATPQAKLWDGWNTGLAPAHEPIIVAMKPLDGGFVDNAEKWRVAGLWVEGCRIPTDSRPKRGNHKERPSDVASSYNLGSRYAIGQTTQGRWPKNLIHDGSDEVKRVFAKAGKMTGGGNVKSGNGTAIWGNAKRRVTNMIERNTGTADRYYKVCPPDRFIYQAKASPSERNKGVEESEKAVNHSAYGEFKGTPEHASNNGQPKANHHPTVKPLALVRELVRLTKTPTGGIVFDPFLGSGTTLLAAQAEGRPGIGCEINEEYCQIARGRLTQEETFYVLIPSPNGTEKRQKVKQLGLFE